MNVKIKAQFAGIPGKSMLLLVETIDKEYHGQDKQDKNKDRNFSGIAEDEGSDYAGGGGSSW